MRGYKVMYDYRGKKVGMALSAIGVIALLFEKFTHFTIFPKLDSEQHYALFLWFTLASLFCIAYSMEKEEDERAKQIRSKAIMIAFMVETGALLAFGLTLAISAHAPKAEYPMVANAQEQIEFGRLLMFIPGVAITIYLIYFHIGLYRDEFWEYQDNVPFMENLRKNYMHIIVLAIAGTLLTLMLSAVFM